MARRLLPHGAEELREFASHLRIGDVNVVDARISLGSGPSDEEALMLDLTLADPSDERETWPVEDILALFRRINERGAELDVALPWYVRIHSTAG